jgi:hypothetical protein
MKKPSGSGQVRHMSDSDCPEVHGRVSCLSPYTMSSKSICTIKSPDENIPSAASDGIC